MDQELEMHAHENLLVVLPRELNDEEFLDLAESEIRAFGGSIVHGIVQIGKKLVEVKDRVRHGKNQTFVRDRLHFSEDAALNFVRSYRLLETQNFRDLETLQLPASAIYLVARPSTPDEVRTEALEKARTGGISLSAVQRLIVDAKTAA